MKRSRRRVQLHASFTGVLLAMALFDQVSFGFSGLIFEGSSSFIIGSALLIPPLVFLFGGTTNRTVAVVIGLAHVLVMVTFGLLVFVCFLYDKSWRAVFGCLVVICAVEGFHTIAFISKEPTKALGPTRGNRPLIGRASED